MSRGFLDEYKTTSSSKLLDDEPDVEVDVRIEHTTRNAIQVSQDRGQTTCWIPRDAILRSSRNNFGPGDHVTITITEKMAEQKELL